MIYIPRILCYVLVVLIGISSAQVVWSLVGDNSVEQTVSNTRIPTSPPKLVAPPTPKPDYANQIARLNLMGRVAASNKVDIKVDEDAPDTSLNLTLSGVLALGSGDGYAIIEDQSRKHKLYHIDDEIISGVTLNSVYSDYVILNRSGRNEKLSLPRATAKGLAGLNSNETSSLPANNQKPIQEEILEDDDDETPLSNLRDNLIKNPSSLRKYVAISPSNNLETGSFQGYQVNPVENEDPALFYDLGFMDGDIVVSINNVDLDNPNKASQALQKLITADELQLTLLREGTPMTLVHNLD
ncbi:MAG: type II secretion system protein GspC [Pseudomonadota bacterium]